MGMANHPCWKSGLVLFLFLFQLASVCGSNAEDHQRQPPQAGHRVRHLQEEEGESSETADSSLWARPAPASSTVGWESKPLCPTGNKIKVLVDTATGEWMFLSGTTVGIDRDMVDHAYEHGYYDLDDDDTNTTFDGGRVRALQQGSTPEPTRLLVPVDPFLFATRQLESESQPQPDSKTTFGDVFSLGRFLSTDGSNSLATEESVQGNLDTLDAVEDEEPSNLAATGKVLRVWARPCGCFDRRDAQEETMVYAICPESSDSCKVDGTSSDHSQISAKCYSSGRVDSIARNLWPLLWMWYFTLLLALGCTFQGRIVLDFVKGTILYYFCGCGDQFRNREMRNVNRYNHAIVEEILDEERVDRQDVRRRRNDGSVASRRMDEIANRSTSHGSNTGDDQARGVPPTIVTSPSFPMDAYANFDTDSDEEDTERTQTRWNNPMDWLAQRLRNVVWPWQTSWKRYIKYNLLLRVEWIAIQDEVAFIESRHQRGLPHARYEMKTRLWNAATDVSCACSLEPSSLAANSVDLPHCTICFMELEDGDRVGDLGCGHVFHADCLKMWVTKRNSCPLCSVPIARRKRISSEELVKEDAFHRRIAADPEAPREANASVTTARPGLGATTASAYDHTLPPPDAFRDAPSHANGGGPRRLTHMPMTPSTVAADVYSNYSEDEFEDLEAVDLARDETPSHSPNSDETDTPYSPQTFHTADPSSGLPSSSITSTVSGRIDRIAEIQELDNESENRMVTNTTLASMDCNINDYLSRDDQGHLSENGCDINLPSPPRPIRRRITNENDNDGAPDGVANVYGNMESSNDISFLNGR